MVKTLLQFLLPPLLAFFLLMSGYFSSKKDYEKAIFYVVWATFILILLRVYL